MNSYAYTTTSQSETIALGVQLGSQLRGGEVIVLISDVGGGKTTFVKGIAQGMGSDETVQSPTFIVSAVYECADDIRLYHYDFYRLQDPGIMRDQLQESLHDGKAVSIVEWSDIVNDVFDADVITITIRATGDNDRSIHCAVPDSKKYIVEKMQ